VLLTKDAHRTLSHSPIDVFSITMIQLYLWMFKGFNFKECDQNIPIMVIFKVEIDQ